VNVLHNRFYFGASTIDSANQNPDHQPMPHHHLSKGLISCFIGKSGEIPKESRIGQCRPFNVTATHLRTKYLDRMFARVNMRLGAATRARA